MDKKTLIAVGLCVLLLVLWPSISKKLFPPKPVPAGVTDTIQAPDTTMSQSGAPVTAASDSAAKPSHMPPVPGSDFNPHETLGLPTDTVPREEFTVTTPLYELRFSNYGGGINRIVLRQYNFNDTGKVVLIDDPDRVIPAIETPLRPIYENKRAFKCDSRGFELQAGDSPRDITYTYTDSAGGQIVKKYTIHPDRYDVGFKLDVSGVENFRQTATYRIDWDIPLNHTEKNAKDDYSNFRVTAMIGGEHEEFNSFDDDTLYNKVDGQVSWTGIGTKYFAAAMIPIDAQTESMIARGRQLKVNIDKKSFEMKQLTTSLDMKMDVIGQVSDSFIIYAGPQHYKTLESYGVGLQEIIQQGWVIIRPFSKAIIWLLPKIYSVIPNYGIVVLIFALLIKVIIYPLSRKQTMAMTKLKDLQPKMKKLQEKYKSDPQRLNKEMMKLYKQAGANPLSGCLPILPQMPLFFALFKVFKSTIEFRGAGFMFWITDLSVPDPYYVLPIIMVVTMFVQQKMTMTDPKNKMMVYLMPLFFGWLFMNFPAGLVLYWTGFNILSLFETIFIRNRMMPQTETAEVQEAKK